MTRNIGSALLRVFVAVAHRPGMTTPAALADTVRDGFLSRQRQVA